MKLRRKTAPVPPPRPVIVVDTSLRFTVERQITVAFPPGTEAKERFHITWQRRGALYNTNPGRVVGLTRSEAVELLERIAEGLEG